MEEDVQFITINDVCSRLGISRSSLWRLVKRDPTFPPKRFISNYQVAFLESEIKEWMLQHSKNKNRFKNNATI